MDEVKRRAADRNVELLILATAAAIEALDTEPESTNAMSVPSRVGLTLLSSVLSPRLLRYLSRLVVPK
jgi:hypothetical protein